MSTRNEPAYGRWYAQMTTAWLQPGRTQRELDFMLPKLQIAPRQAILDVGCNSGRHSIALAQRGYTVTGVDPEPEAIELAKSAAAAAAVTARFLCGDMAAMQLDGFAAAICLGTSIGFHETEQGDQAQLSAIHRALARGGRFGLEMTWLFSQRYGSGVRQTWERVGDVLVLDEGRLDALTCRAHHVTDYITDEGTRRREEQYRVYAPTEITAMLRTAGFTIEAVYGDYSWAALDLESPTFIAICRKTE